MMYEGNIHKKSRFAVFFSLALIIILLVFATGCTTKHNPKTYQNVHEPMDAEMSQSCLNKVYESVELVTLIMHLAGAQEFTVGGMRTDYQRNLMETFGEFANHPAVEYIREFRASGGNFGFDAPARFALYLEMTGEGFRFREGADFEAGDWIGRLAREQAERFLYLVNDFYIESNFAEFFEAHIPYYKEHTRRLMDELFGQINFDWFSPFGLDPDALRITIYPSGGMGAFGFTILGYAYAVIPGGEDYSRLLETVIHEFVHSFADPIADAWYADEENSEFRRLSGHSVNPIGMPFYGTGALMAREYVTRAYTILYMVENHNAHLAFSLMSEISNGFPYIETVFAMITEHEPLITPETDLISVIMRRDVEYTLGEKQRAVQPAMRVYWQELDVNNAEISLEGLDFEISQQSIYGTHEGDMVFVGFYNSNRIWEERLLIDIGPHREDFPQIRDYANFVVDEHNNLDSIFAMLGVEYSLGEEQSFTFREEIEFFYQFVNFLDFELSTKDFLGFVIYNIFDTQTGDVIIVSFQGNRHLYIDVGSAEMPEEPDMRLYSFFPLDIF